MQAWVDEHLMGEGAYTVFFDLKERPRTSKNIDFFPRLSGSALVEAERRLGWWQGDFEWGYYQWPDGARTVYLWRNYNAIELHVMVSEALESEAGWITLGDLCEHPDIEKYTGVLHPHDGDIEEIVYMLEECGAVEIDDSEGSADFDAVFIRRARATSGLGESKCASAMGG